MGRLPHETTTTVAPTLDGGAVALLPTGATEQHGPALPLGTDFMVARALAREVGDRDDVIVLPAIPVGVSEHHRQFDGTLWVDPDVFQWYVSDVITSIASHGIDRVVIVNGHGGNSDALRRVARELRQDRTAFVAPWNWRDATEELEAELFDGTSGHAGAVESSMMMYIAEEHVRDDTLEAAEAGASPEWGQQVHGARLGFDTVDFSQSGACGTPTEASQGAGQHLFGWATDELDALVEWLAEQAIADLWPRDHR